MEKSGVTQINIGNIDGLTIFSPNGNAIKHTELKITGNDIVIRNLHFKEMWQWDDAGAQKEVGNGDYSKQKEVCAATLVVEIIRKEGDKQDAGSVFTL